MSKTPRRPRRVLHHGRLIDPRRCTICRGGLKRIENADDGRPHFKCTKCGDTFTSGKSGEPYASALMEKADLGGEASQ